MTNTKIHPAIQEELDMLRERYPNKTEITLDEYADYFGLERKYAGQHFRRLNEKSNKMSHKKLGRKIIIPLIDFAYWLAKQKVVEGKLLILPSREEVEKSMKSRRGFSSTPKYNYRSLG